MDFPQQPACKEEVEVLADQQLWNQEEPEPPQVKEEQEDLCISQQRELLVVKVEADTFMVTPVNEENNHSEVKLNNVPHLQLCNQERNSSLDQEEQDATQIKEEKLPELKQETGSFMVPDAYEKNEHSETEPTSDHQLCHSASEAGMQTQGAAKNSNPVSAKQKIVYFSPDMKIRTMKKQFTCKICPKTFIQGLHLKHHMKIHSGENDLQIKEEESCINQEEELLELKQETDTLRVTPTYEENDNSETKPNGEHLLLNTSPKAESKSQGARKNLNPGSTKQKMVYFSPDMKIRTMKMQFTCKICFKRFIQNLHLENHMKSHMGEKPYACKICGKSYPYSSSVSYHMKVHRGEKPCSCKTCGKSFTHSSSLRYHMRVHRGERPYSCEICPKSFTSSSNLNCHMRVHSGEKPYFCDTCGQNFSTHKGLAYHMKTHTGEKPFSCEICGYCCRELAGLNKHMKRHINERLYSCETCGKCFRQHNHLTKHLATHTGGKV
ncbi:uncharacterized protein KZ484_017942 [Pholidichthys leucotaenia]